MTRRKGLPAESVEPVTVREAKIEAALLAADVLALLNDPQRTRSRMARRRTAGEFSAVVLVADAVGEMVRRELADRRARGLPLTDDLMLSRRLLTDLVARAFRSAP